MVCIFSLFIFLSQFQQTMLKLISDRLQHQIHDDMLEIAWSAMWNVTDETPVNCQRFLDGHGMTYFQKCLRVSIVVVLILSYECQIKSDWRKNMILIMNCLKRRAFTVGLFFVPDLTFYITSIHWYAHSQTCVQRHKYAHPLFIVQSFYLSSSSLLMRNLVVFHIHRNFLTNQNFYAIWWGC